MRRGATSRELSRLKGAVGSGISLAQGAERRESVTCKACYDRGYYLITKDEEWEWVRCDCFLDKEKGNGNV